MIRVQSLSKRFGDIQALDELSFTMERGEILGLLGPNGAGKTTILRILTGFMPADSGRVELDGVDLETAGAALRRRGGYLPESNPLYAEMSVRASLGFFGGLYGLGGIELVRARSRVMADFGLEGYASRRVRTLSKGYRQRLGLAQALLHDPDILFLDEPTAGLDPVNVGELRRLIRACGRVGGGDKTVVISTHLLSEVEAICDRVLILNRGRAVAAGDLAELSRDLTGGTRYELRVAFPSDTRQDWSGAPGLRRVQPLGESGEGRWLCDLDEDGEAPARLAAWIHAQGGSLYELRPRRAGLEEIFLGAIHEEEG